MLVNQLLELGRRQGLFQHAVEGQVPQLLEVPLYGGAESAPGTAPYLALGRYWTAGAGPVPHPQPPTGARSRRRAPAAACSGNWRSHHHRPAAHSLSGA
uniref:Uncharacterized protein n=1 Tax=Tanacetum cinerariifolium TaxID=118510 RepID=A0A699TLS4_TANCI|nr:hypothetical protein [Tanacetum cinerariifolium]